MNCNECEFCLTVNNDAYEEPYKVCRINNHIINNNTTCHLMSGEKLEDMNICFNCKYWMGGGDFGLSCHKNYYISSCNGFDKACKDFDKFERK